jgi:hypothetical protein
MRGTDPVDLVAMRGAKIGRKFVETVQSYTGIYGSTTATESHSGTPTGVAPVEVRSNDCAMNCGTVVEKFSRDVVTSAATTLNCAATAAGTVTIIIGTVMVAATMAAGGVGGIAVTNQGCDERKLRLLSIKPYHQVSPQRRDGPTGSFRRFILARPRSFCINKRKKPFAELS